MNIPPPESNVSDTTAGKTRYYNMKMPVSSYHGGELHIQNRIQYEYSAPPNLQIKREDANRSVITCHRAMWVQIRLAWYYIPPPETRNMSVLRR